ncbi:MAG: hypothetical protein ABI656_10940 [bacterium]
MTSYRFSGTQCRSYLEENVKFIDLKISKDDLAALDAIFQFGAATLVEL